MLKFSEKIPLTSHLKELRERFVVISIVLFVFFGVCFYFRDFLLNWVQLPLPRQFARNLTFISPTEPLFTAMKVSFMGSLFISMPVILHQAWLFIGPGLKAKEKKVSLLFVISGSFFFLLGGAFCYFLVLPLGLKFLLQFGAYYWKMEVTIGLYISFVVKLMLAFAFAFQTPLILVFLAKLGLVSTVKMKRCRKWAFLGCFVLSALLTPPDVISQVLLAFPLYGLYEFGLFASYFFEDPKQREAASEDVRERFQKKTGKDTTQTPA